MLHRVEHSNGVVTYQSPRLAALGVIHGFSTRVGGISPGNYATLNLAGLAKDAQSDANTRIAENFRRLRRALGCVRYPRVEVKQVHGSDVWTPPPGPVPLRDVPSADAMVSDRPGQLLTIRTADCVPILLADDTGRVVAAVHAGWRGVVAGVAPATVQRMTEQFGISAAKVVAAIGPHIRRERFEVGPEVAQAFEAAGLAEAVWQEAGARPHVDMQQAVLLQLARVGVTADRVDLTDCCTYDDRAQFYSYRRDGQVSGRMAAVIAVRQDHV